MTALDVFLIIIGLAFVIFGLLERTVRVIMMLLGFYIVSIGVGFVTLASHTIGRLATSALGVVGARAPNIVIIQTFFFLGLGVPALIIIYIASHIAFPDTSLPKLGPLDYFFGIVLGVVLAGLIMAVLCNTWGVAVSVRWNPMPTWSAMREAFVKSQLRPTLNQILGVYRRLLFPFRFMGYPIFFLPVR
jgi:hypothetical protein